MGVVHKRGSQHAFISIDIQCFDQAVGIEMPCPDTQVALRQLRRKFNGALAFNLERNRRCAILGTFTADQTNPGVTRQEVEQRLQQPGFLVPEHLSDHFCF